MALSSLCEVKETKTTSEQLSIIVMEHSSNIK